MYTGSGKTHKALSNSCFWIKTTGQCTSIALYYRHKEKAEAPQCVLERERGFSYGSADFDVHCRARRERECNSVEHSREFQLSSVTLAFSE